MTWPASITLNTPLRSRSARMMADTWFRRHRFVGECGDRDRDLVAADAGDFDAQLGMGGHAHQQGGRKQQICSFFMCSFLSKGWVERSVQVFHLKLTTKVRSTVPSFFFGSGDDLLMPRSTASSKAGMPLLLVLRTERISPVGNCSTRNDDFRIARHIGAAG
jgi:hypothetical protein